ncbi:(2Fe-2S)-binding protein [Halobacteriales archaeon QS_8_69_26]|nr:MAG: (2Fe-2S)-binding protein [Halobacteriales archaeon QS_8_69_26]
MPDDEPAGADADAGVEEGNTDGADRGTAAEGLDDVDPDQLRPVIASGELEDGDRVIAEIDGREIAVFRVNGELYALLNYCTHQGGPVCEGLLSGTLGMDEDGTFTWDREGKVIACPWHGWEFDITDGYHLASERYRIPTYPVTERDGQIYVVL